MSLPQTNFIEYGTYMILPVRLTYDVTRQHQGYAKTPYPWQPGVVHIQMMRVGQLVILVVPGEFTTMSGRRIRYELTNMFHRLPR
jgi:Neutral/alkaline non-lysosomal ceramidase, N-terminal